MTACIRKLGRPRLFDESMAVGEAHIVPWREPPRDPHAVYHRSSCPVARALPLAGHVGMLVLRVRDPAIILWTWRRELPCGHNGGAKVSNGRKGRAIRAARLERAQDVTAVGTARASSGWILLTACGARRLCERRNERRTLQVSFGGRRRRATWRGVVHVAFMLWAGACGILVRMICIITQIRNAV